MSNPSISSLEADEFPEVKEITQALHPWPMSNEESWYIVMEKLKRHRTLELSLRHADKLVQTLIERHERVKRFIGDNWTEDEIPNILITVRKILEGEE